MKKFITILLSGSLALAVCAQAKPEEGKKKKQGEQQDAQGGRPDGKAEQGPRPNARARERANMNPNAGQQRMQNKQERAARKANGKAASDAQVQSTLQSNPSYRKQHADDNAKPGEKAETQGQMNAAKAGKKNQAQAQANAANAAKANENTQTQGQANAAKGAKAANFEAQANQQRKQAAMAKKPDTAKIQAIRSEHKDFHAQARPSQVAAVTFNQNYRIRGSDTWRGERYAAFRDYRPGWHDRNWYHHRYNTIVLIGGGYYYWNSGFWYPAWGYAPSESYYAYDGPIYTGRAALPPDQVIANVQAVLQEQGYYTGEVDGLLGPLTREALSQYQADNGLYVTAAIDEPTLSSLDMNG